MERSAGVEIETESKRSSKRIDQSKGKKMITEKQKLIRNKCIGSSDAPVILGVSPWATPYDLWLQKTGQVPPTEENSAMRIGTVLEAPLLQLAGERLGVKVVRPTSSYVGCQPFFRANIDGMIGEAKRGADIVEIKTTSQTDGWGTEGTDEVPDMVKVQVAYQMSCSSSQVAYVACLTGSFGLSFKVYRIPFDADFCGYVMQQCERWWRTHMEQGVPPETSGTIDVLKQIRRTDSQIELPSELFEAQSAAKEKLKLAEAEYEAAHAALVTALGTNKRGVCATHSVSVTEIQSDRFDRKSFEQEHSELAKQYVVPSAYNRIDVRKLKGKSL